MGAYAHVYAGGESTAMDYAKRVESVPRIAGATC
jgi:hypothetical protein